MQVYDATLEFVLDQVVKITYRNCSVTSEKILACPVLSTNAISSDPRRNVADKIWISSSSSPLELIHLLISISAFRDCRTVKCSSME